MDHVNYAECVVIQTHFLYSIQTLIIARDCNIMYAKGVAHRVSLGYMWSVMGLKAYRQ